MQCGSSRTLPQHAWPHSSLHEASKLWTSTTSVLNSPKKGCLVWPSACCHAIVTQQSQLTHIPAANASEQLGS